MIQKTYICYMEINPARINEFAGILENKFPGICFAYLFGSASTGNVSPSSDIDLAVYLNQNEDKISLLPEIIGEAERIFPGRTIDLVILNDAGELIALEALKGKNLFIREESLDQHAEFYSLTCRLVEDRLAWMKRQLIYRGYEIQWNH